MSESLGIGLLAQFMVEMRMLEKKKNSRDRLTPAQRLTGALKYLRLLAKEYPESSCELLVDDKPLAGNFPFVRSSQHGPDRP